MKEIFVKWLKRFRLKASNIGLFLVIFWTFVIMPLFTNMFVKQVFDLSVTLIILVSVYATSENRSLRVMLQVVLAILAIWIARITDTRFLNDLAKLFLVVFFLVRVVKFIRQVSSKEDVNSTVITEAINGYLLLGIAFGVLVDFVIKNQPEAFNFSGTNNMTNFFDPFYYSFVTMSTLGYGDLLPQTDASKAMAILITLSGQIYLVTIMAFLIGKLISQRMVSKD